MTDEDQEVKEIEPLLLADYGKRYEGLMIPPERQGQAHSHSTFGGGGKYYSIISCAQNMRTATFTCHATKTRSQVYMIHGGTSHPEKGK